MGTLKKIGLSTLFLFLSIALLSWQSGLNGEYCNVAEIDEKHCTSYNLVPFILIKFADFLHHFESAFIILSTVAIAWFTFELRKATFGLKGSTDRLWAAGEKQLRFTQRSYIAVEPEGVLPFIGYTGEDESIARIKIRNVGGCVAKNVRWTMNQELHRGLMREDFPNRERDFGQSNDIAPGIAQYSSQNTRIQTDDPVEVIQEIGTAYYVWEIVRYTDVFGGDRFTKFCHRYGPDCLFTISKGIHAGRRGLTGKKAKYHQWGNKTDDLD